MPGVSPSSPVTQPRSWHGNKSPMGAGWEPRGLCQTRGKPANRWGCRNQTPNQGLQGGSGAATDSTQPWSALLPAPCPVLQPGHPGHRSSRSWITKPGSAASRAELGGAAGLPALSAAGVKLRWGLHTQQHWYYECEREGTCRKLLLPLLLLLLSLSALLLLLAI